MHPDISASKVRGAFPLYMREELEVPVNQMGFVIGVKKDYPARLREMISAAAITYQLQNSSIDHVRKTYLKSMSYEEDEGGSQRFDRDCRRHCQSLIDSADKFLKAYPAPLKREPTVGEWIGDLTLVRVNYSFERAFAEADKGALYESVAIGRMILEQVCWAYCIRPYDEVDSVVKKSVTRCVGEASRSFPAIGRLYGWMSGHAHWAYSAHLKVITRKDEQAGAVFASSFFKAISYAMLVALVDIYRRIVNSFAQRHKIRTLSAIRAEWSKGARAFKPEALLLRINQLTGGSPDVSSLLGIIKDQSRHG